MQWVQSVIFMLNIQLKISADMFDSVKQKRHIHCPYFYWGFSFQMQAKKLRIGVSRKLSMASINWKSWIIPKVSTLPVGI